MRFLKIKFNKKYLNYKNLLFFSFPETQPTNGGRARAKATEQLPNGGSGSRWHRHSTIHNRRLQSIQTTRSAHPVPTARGHHFLWGLGSGLENDIYLKNKK